MSLVWAEPFDQYGSNLSGLLAQSGYNVVKGVTASPGRTGNYGINFNWNFGGQDGFLTRPLDTPTTTIGMGAAIAPQGGQMNANSFNGAGFVWYSTGVTTEMHVSAMSDGSLAIFDRTNTNKGQTPPNMLIPNAFVWVEAVAIGNTGGANTGYAEIRINGISKLIVNNINLPNQFAYHGMGGAGAGNQNCQFDDWITWNGLGTKNNTFMSDRRLLVCVPTANGTNQDFTYTGASAWQSCNVIPPVDTTYIQGAAAGNISEFVKAAVTINSTDIAAIVVAGRLFKTDSGTATVRLGIDSSANVQNSPDISPGTTGAFYYYPVELDPNGSIPWTKTSANAATLRITRDT